MQPLPPCGSWLASDGGGSVNASGNDIALSRGQLAPTVGWVGYSGQPLPPCGSWLASDGGESVNASGNDIAPSRGKLAPTVERARYSGQPLPPCGSWLASDGGESVNASGNDIAPSRGKLAPTVERVGCNRYHPVGAGLPAMAVSRSMHPALTLLYCEASSLLRWVTRQH